MQLVESFIDETDYAVWVDIAGNLSRLGTLLSHTNYEAAFESFNRRLFHKIGVNVGWDSKDNEGVNLKPDVVRLFAHFELDICGTSL